MVLFFGGTPRLIAQELGVPARKGEGEAFADMPRHLWRKQVQLLPPSVDEKVETNPSNPHAPKRSPDEAEQTQARQQQETEGRP